MAIFSRSERNLEPVLNNSSIKREHYEYENNLNYNNKTLKQNLVPFNISEERLTHTVLDDNPGPGSYFKYIDKNKTFMSKKLETNKDHVLNEFPIYNLVSFLNNKKLNDLKQLKIDKRNKSQVQKLKYSNHEETKVPKRLNIKLIQLNQNKKDGILSNNLENIKDLKIGPMSPKKLINKSENLDDSGKKIIKDLKNKELLSSNCSTNTSTNFPLNIQITSPDENSKIFFNDISSTSSTNKDKKIIKENLLRIRTIKLNSLHRKKIWNKTKQNFDVNNLISKFKDNNFRNELFYYNNLLTGEPGPGYYSTRSPFDKYEIISQENKKYNFGSNQDRGMLITKSKSKTELKKEKNYLKIENINKKNKSKFPVLSKDKINFRDSTIKNNLIKQLLNLDNITEEINKSMALYKNNISSDVGPWKYDIKSQFDTNNSKQYSFPLSKRFFQFKKITPGPGSYLPLKTWNKNNSNNKDKSSVLEQLKIEQYEEEDNRPDMCTYSPHFIKSIEYDNFISTNNIDRTKAPFGSSQEKFIKKINSSNDIIGPGVYNLEKMEKKFSEKKGIMKYKKYFEKNKIKKENIKKIYKHTLEMLKNKIGPGSYINNKKIYTDWYKKTFNVTCV